MIGILKRWDSIKRVLIPYFPTVRISIQDAVNKFIGFQTVTKFNNHLANGKYSYDRENYKEAREEFRAAVKLQPKHPEALTYHGMTQHKMGNVKLAIQDYKDAIKYNQEYTEAYFNLGNLYLERGDYEQHDYDLAIKEYTKAIHLNSDYAKAYNNRGYAYDEKGEYDRAIQDYDQAICLNPDNADAYYNRGLVRYTKQWYKDAIKDCSKAISLTQDPKLEKKSTSAAKTSRTSEITSAMSLLCTSQHTQPLRYCLSTRGLA